MVLGSIQKNIPALHVIQQLRRTDSRVQTGIERLASGLRINRAKDDPGGLVFSSKLSTQFRGLYKASENAQSALNLTEVATGAMDTIVTHLEAIRELAVGAASGGGTSAQQAEIRERLEDMDVIARRTRFGHYYLLNGSYNSQASFQAGTRDFGGRISFGPNASTLFEGSSFLQITRVQEGSERIGSAGDGRVNTGISQATDIAVSVGQLANGAAAAGAGDLLTSLTFNRVTLTNPGRISLSGVLADGATEFHATVSITPTNTVSDLVTAIQSAVDLQESGLGIDTAGGTGAYETNVRYNATTGRMEFVSGAVGTPSQFDVDFTVYNNSSLTAQTSVGIDRVATVDNVLVAAGSATGARIGNSLTAVTGSTFASGTFDIEITSVQAAAQRRITMDTRFSTDAGGTTAVGAAANMSGTYFGGVQIANGDTFAIAGTDPDGSTFSTTYTVAAASGGIGSGVVRRYSDLVNELRARDRSRTGYGFNNAFVSLASGYLQIEDDIAQTSSTNLSILFTDVSTSNTVSSDAAVNTAGNRERASVSLAGSNPVLVEAGEVVTLSGGNIPAGNEPDPTVTFRLGSGLQTGTDSLVIREQIYEGSLNNGAAVLFRNGQSNVTFTSGSSSLTAASRYQSLSLDFDNVLNVTASPSDGGEIFELRSTGNDLTFHIGPDSNQNKQFFSADLRIQKLGLSSTRHLDTLDITTVSGANEAIDIVDAALEQVNAVRGRIGAFSARLTDTIDELDTTGLNVEDGYRQIVGVDIAEETTSLAMNTILMQAQTAVLVQANNSPMKIFEMLYGID